MEFKYNNNNNKTNNADKLFIQAVFTLAYPQGCLYQSGQIALMLIGP